MLKPLTSKMGTVVNVVNVNVRGRSKELICHPSINLAKYTVFLIRDAP